MKLIIGIGNPGEKYDNTRHNIGYLVVDEILKKIKLTARLETKFEAYISIFIHKGEKVIVAKPITYVNLSGNAVYKIMKYYKIDIEDLLVVVDDINLPIGKIRLRELGSDGGHNGLKNIIEVLGTKDFKRIRIGIGLDKELPLNNYVLGKITQSEYKILSPIIEACSSAALEFAEKVYFKDIMTKYNSKKDNDD
ncbi:aminoacyl-tRNA hydrolase [Acholeplasma sp. OttesenSCG-928-E16]|nr:aminoacyl-tRNA hydrolase [Acholeplasma sp. OttesenSCG-928-E16]